MNPYGRSWLPDPAGPNPEPSAEQYEAAEARVAESLTADDLHDVLCEHEIVKPCMDALLLTLFREHPQVREYALRRFDARVEDMAQEIMQAEIERARREARAA
jgi:hypothetical protein